MLSRRSAFSAFQFFLTNFVSLLLTSVVFPGDTERHHRISPNTPSYFDTLALSLLAEDHQQHDCSSGWEEKRDSPSDPAEVETQFEEAVSQCT